MNASLKLTADEVGMIVDRSFFPAKTRITGKVRGMLDGLHVALKEEVAASSLVTPGGFDPGKCQFVKGEHLEDYPYQYLDYPKHFVDEDMFTFRTLFWWGHHVVFALILQGAQIRQYKKQVVDRFHALAGQDLALSLAPTLWEWKQGEGFTLPITHDRKAQLAAVLAERSFFKIVRFIPLNDPRLAEGRLPELGRTVFRAMLPIISR